MGDGRYAQYKNALTKVTGNSCSSSMTQQDPITSGVPSLATIFSSSSLSAAYNDTHHASTISFRERHEPAHDTTGATPLRWQDSTAVSHAVVQRWRGAGGSAGRGATGLLGWGTRRGGVGLAGAQTEAQRQHNNGAALVSQAEPLRRSGGGGVATTISRHEHWRKWGQRQIRCL